MIDFRKDLSKRQWKYMFFGFLSLVIVETALFMVIFFVLPNSFTVSSMVDASVKFASLPAKYLMVLVIGGFSKDFFIGYFTCKSYVEWKR